MNEGLGDALFGDGSTVQVYDEFKEFMEGLDDEHEIKFLKALGEVELIELPDELKPKVSDD